MTVRFDTATVEVTVLPDEVTTGFDLDVVEPLGVPATVKLFTWTNSTVTITNNGPEISSAGTVTVTGVGSVSGRSQVFTFNLPALAVGANQTFTFRWSSIQYRRYHIGSSIDWTAEVLLDDSVPANNTATATTVITR